MLGLVLRKKYISSSITTEYVNSMKQLNQAKSNPSATNYASNEFGIKSPYNTYSIGGGGGCIIIT